MLRITVVLALVAAVTAKVAYIKTKEEIQAFRAFLDQTQIPSAARVSLNAARYPLANIEENSGFFEGDIFLTDDQKESLVERFATGSRNGIINRNYIWPNKTLIYEIDESFFDDRHIEAIEAGLDDLRKLSCIDFRRRNESDVAWVAVTGLPAGCYAQVGFNGNIAHRLNLEVSAPGVGCFRHGTIIHEFLHSLGFWHMHSTHDRDDWVEIVWDNIPVGSQHNFFYYDNRTVSNYGTDYDYGSVLHYSEYGFSINGDRTIVAIKPYNGLIGQRIGLSESDVLKLNRLYQCPGFEGW